MKTEQFTDKKQNKRRKLFSFIIFIVILGIIIAGIAIEFNKWWKVRKEYVRMGLARDKFPFRMYSEKDLVEMGRWPVESEYYDSIPTRTTPEETYAKFRQAIIEEDIDKALECFWKEKREEISDGLKNVLNDKELKNQMLKDLPEKIEGVETFEKSLTYYEYFIIREGERWAQAMSFVKDLNGDWFLENL